MSNKIKIHGVSARSPRHAYALGLDVLGQGAGYIIGASATQATATGNKSIALASKLKAKFPKAAAGFASVGQKVLQKAKTVNATAAAAAHAAATPSTMSAATRAALATPAAVHASAAAAQARTAPAARVSAATRSIANAIPARAVTVRQQAVSAASTRSTAPAVSAVRRMTSVRGDAGMVNSTVMRLFAISLEAIDAMNAAGDFMASSPQLPDLITQLDNAGQGTVANAGQAIVDRFNAATTNAAADPDAWGSAADVATWNQIVTDAQAWVPQAQAALQSPSAFSATGMTNPWYPGTVYVVGQLASNQGSIYKCITGGTSGQYGPYGMAASIPDGSVVWAYSGVDNSAMAQQGFDPGAGGGSSGGDGSSSDGGPDWDSMPEAGGDDQGGGNAADASSDDDGSDGSWTPESDYGTPSDDGGALPDGSPDPFADDDSSSNGSDASMDDEDMSSMSSGSSAGDLDDDMLGMEFKWQYLLLPHLAIQDAMDERNAAAPTSPGYIQSATGLADPTLLSSAQVHANPALAAKLAASTAKLAETKRQLAALHATQLKVAQAAAAAQSAPASAVAPDGSTASSDSATAVVGYTMSDLNDIILESYEEQISDAEPDWERRRASVHRGASYLQDYAYPPHGASAGQEGGSIDPEQRIEVMGASAPSSPVNLIAVTAPSSVSAVTDGPSYDDVVHYPVAKAVVIIGSNMQISTSGDSMKASALIGKTVSLYVDGVYKGAHKWVETDGGTVVYRRSSVPSQVTSRVIRRVPNQINGESMNNDIKIMGDGYTRGLDILGVGPVRAPLAVPPRAGFVMKPTPGGNMHTAMVAMKAHAGDHKTTILNAKDVGNRAIRIGNNLNAALKKAAVKAKTTRVHGAPARKLAPHKRLSPAQMKKIADQAVKSGNDLLKYTAAYAAKVQTHDAKVSTGAKAMAAKMHVGQSKGQKVSASAMSAMRQAAASGTMKAGRAGLAPSAVNHPVVTRAATSLRGVDPDDMIQIFGAYEEKLDDILIALDPNNGPDFNNPGYLLDGSIDPSQADPSNPGYLVDGGLDPAYYGGTAVTDGSDPTLGPPNYGCAPPPATAPGLPAGSFTPDPYGPSGSNDFKDPNWYNSTNTDTSQFMPMPQNPVWLDGTKSIGKDDLISYSWAFLTPGAAGGNLSGFHTDRNGVWNNFISWDNSNDDDHQLNSAETADMYAASTAHNYGPLMGNPNNGSHGAPSNPDYKGLRYDLGTNRWFWYYDVAPKWAKAGQDGLAYNQMIADFKTCVTAAATDAATQAAADQLAADQAKETARQNAASDAATQEQINQQQMQAQAQSDLQNTSDQQTYQSGLLQDQGQQAYDQRQQEIDDASFSRMAQLQQQLSANQDQQDLALAQQLDAAQSGGGSGDAAQDDGSSDDGSYAAQDPASALDDESFVDPGTQYDPNNMDLDNDFLGTALRGSARFKARSQSRR